MRVGDKFLMDCYHSSPLKVIGYSFDNVKMLDNTGAEYLFSKKRFGTNVIAQLRNSAPRKINVGDVVFDRHNSLALCTIEKDHGDSFLVHHHYNDTKGLVAKTDLISDISVEVGDKYTSIHTKGHARIWKVIGITERTSGKHHPTIVKLETENQFLSPFLDELHSRMKRIETESENAPIYIHKEIVVALAGNKVENVPLKMKFDAIDRGEKYIRRVLTAWPIHQQLRHKFITESDILKCVWFWEDISE
jgi:hypothetical protein